MKKTVSVRRAVAASVAVLGCAVALLGPTGCKKINEAKDCRGLCSHFKDCQDSLIDTDACEDRCTDRADDNETLRNQVDGCTDCIDNKSCAEVTAACTSCVAAYQAIR
ncbi:hypothetical protein EON77_18360 [bacterium]|nr:MAG: hypothetical protein EON77_18360 [bacterium]